MDTKSIKLLDFMQRLAGSEDQVEQKETDEEGIKSEDFWIRPLYDFSSGVVWGEGPCPCPCPCGPGPCQGPCKGPCKGPCSPCGPCIPCKGPCSPCKGPCAPCPCAD